MSHYAKVISGVVNTVIVAEEEFIISLEKQDNVLWVKTSYNTRDGIHYNSETNEPDGGVPLRRNYAGIGCIYDPIEDVFIIPPAPYVSMDPK